MRYGRSDSWVCAASHSHRARRSRISDSVSSSDVLSSMASPGSNTIRQSKHGSMHSLNRRAWIEVDLGALSRNAARVASQTGVPLLPMVKADAYGLGAVRVARTLERIEPYGYGVATIAEGEELRRAAIARPILVFTPLLAGDFDAAVRANLTPTLGAADTIARWHETGLPWHLAVDTGMSRAGVQWNEVGALREVLAAAPPEGVF